MKHLKIAIMALLVVAGLSSVNAQDENNPWAISVGVNAVDFHPTNKSGNLTNAGADSGWYDEFFNADDHYNIIPSISRVSVARYIDAGFSVELSGNLNKITKMGNFPIETNPNQNFIGLDGNIKYDLDRIIGDTKWFDPYALLGGGYTWYGSNGAATLNGGLGVNLWFSDNVGLNLQSSYKHTFDNVNLDPHFQHVGGIVFKFGGKDTDDDGIYDKDDACPEVFGLKAFNGCPDTDGDGVQDSADSCPEVFGLATLNGCPDKDGDGIADVNDECPNLKGSKALKGCPDFDGDGINDRDDNCPKVVGPASNKGCPWPDTDGDGILDKDDNCPKVQGIVANNGCPEVIVVEEVVAVSQQSINELKQLARTIYFNTGKSSFKAETYGRLDAIADIISNYPNAKFEIQGHTDSVGSASLNQRLSQKRADAVRSYLVSKGVSSSNLSSYGYGEDQPVMTNKTKAGRAQNRRVEIRLRR